MLTVTWEEIRVQNWFNRHPLSRPRRNVLRTAIPKWELNEAYEARSYSVDSYYNFNKTYRAFQKFLARSPRREEVVDMSARIGMRGAFELLCSFKGVTLLEKLQFHNAWYDLIEAYSIRKLNHPQKDKVYAIEGIAYFIRVNIGFDFQLGVWANHVPLTLFWMRGGQILDRPKRRLPTWTWASIDGRIANPLKVLLHNSSSANKMLSISLLCGSISVAAGTNLRISKTRVMEIKAKDITVIMDVNSSPMDENLFCIPLLLLESSSRWRMKSRTQIHGFILRNVQETSLSAECPTDFQQYQRVGYFWSEQKLLEKKVTGNPLTKLVNVSIV